MDVSGTFSHHLWLSIDQFSQTEGLSKHNPCPGPAVWRPRVQQQHLSQLFAVIMSSNVTIGHHQLAQCIQPTQHLELEGDTCTSESSDSKILTVVSVSKHKKSRMIITIRVEGGWHVSWVTRQHFAAHLSMFRCFSAKILHSFSIFVCLQFQFRNISYETHVFWAQYTMSTTVHKL